MLAALALFRVLRRETHENNLTGDHPDCLRVVVLFSAFPPIPEHFLCPRDQGGSGLFQHAIRVPVVATDVSEEDLAALAPLLVVVRRCLAMQEANGMKWKLPAEEEALLREQLGAQTEPPLAEVFDRLQRSTEQLLSGEAGVLAALQRSVQESCEVFGAGADDEGHAGGDDDAVAAPLQYISVDVRKEDTEALAKAVEAKLASGTVSGTVSPTVSPMKTSGESEGALGQQPIKCKPKLHTTLCHCAGVDASSPKLAQLLAYEDTPVRMQLLGVYDMRPEKELVAAKVSVDERVLTMLGLETRVDAERRALARESGCSIGLHITLWHGGGVQPAESNDILADAPMIPLEG
jgi:hypothetical protein